MTAGILAVAKPQGVTSRDAVNVVQRLVKPIKVGHAGTLDPLATGVLVICLGGATRLVPWIQNGQKHYVAGFRLGVTSDTDDITGTVIPSGDFSRITREAVIDALQHFTGRYDQVPPQYSAVHVQGQRAYDLARQGIVSDLAAKTVDVESIALTAWNPPDFTVEILCGSGTYVRSIGRDVGQRLGCGALMTALERRAVGPFRLEDGVTLDNLDRPLIMANLRPPRDAVAHLPSVRLTTEEIQKLRQGQRCLCGGNQPLLPETDYAALNDDGALIGIITPTGEQPARWTSRIILPFTATTPH
jgi:tRNA pseudouridine55 synthase